MTWTPSTRSYAPGGDGTLDGDGTPGGDGILDGAGTLDGPGSRDLRIPEPLLHRLLDDLSEDARTRLGRAVGDWIAGQMEAASTGVGEPAGEDEGGEAASDAREEAGARRGLSGIPVERFWSDLGANFHDAGWAQVRQERIHPGLVRLTFEAMSEAARPLLPSVVSTLLAAAGGAGLAVALLPSSVKGSEAHLVFGAPAAVAALEAGLAQGLDEEAALANL